MAYEAGDSCIDARRRPSREPKSSEQWRVHVSTAGDVTKDVKFLRKGQLNRHIFYEAELVPSRVL